MTTPTDPQPTGLTIEQVQGMCDDVRDIGHMSVTAQQLRDHDAFLRAQHEQDQARIRELELIYTPELRTIVTRQVADLTSQLAQVIQERDALTRERNSWPVLRLEGSNAEVVMLRKQLAQMTKEQETAKGLTKYRAYELAQLDSRTILHAPAPGLDVYLATDVDAQLAAKDAEIAKLKGQHG